MKIEDHLTEEQKQQLRKSTKKKRRKTEKVNWIEIMGINRDRYGRGRGGAMRRK